MQLKEWVDTNREFFTEHDLRFLLKEKLSIDANLISRKDFLLDEANLIDLEEIKRVYTEGLPMAYILEKEEFFGLKFKVNPEVLIPRKETELIVEKAIELIKKNNLKYILDLGCGSANIAIAISKSMENRVNIFSSDISLQALMVAKTNSLSHDADIKLINTDLFEGFKKNCFDLVVSNPPYVGSRDIKDSLKYEPLLALEAGSDGLAIIKKILFQSNLYLKKGGYLIMEIGYNQKELVENMLQNIDSYEIIEWIKDYSGNWRGVILHSA